MHSLKLHFLGPPRIEVDGMPVDLQRHKALAMLAYLAVTGEEQRRDTLAALFWPESTKSRARASLRRDLSELNKALGGGWLTVEQDAVGLHKADIWLDVTQFHSRLAECYQPGHAIADSLSRLTEVVELYRDDFLAGFTLPDCPDFDEWQFFQTEALRQALSSALERMVEMYRTQDECTLALPYGRRWLALDPTHEPAHRQLMWLYIQADQKAAALRQYQTCVQILDAELGIAPSQETTALYERIRVMDSGRGPAKWMDDETVTPIFTSATELKNNLPAPATPFVGRTHELAEIMQSLTGLDCRLLTLIGPGGIGKTRLAIEAAQNLVADPTRQSEYVDGIYFVRLVSLQSTSELSPAIANELDLPLNPDIEPDEQLLGYLNDRKMLLVLDNFEHLLDGNPEAVGGADFVADMLSAASGVKLVATSREALNVQGECLYPVEGMRYPSESSLSDIEDYSAVKLFAQSAHRVRPDFDLTAQLNCVVRICRLVEGMPLAIELAAAWLKVMPCNDIAQQIELSLDLLTTSIRNVPPRHRSIRAVFDHSWQLLTLSEQALLCGLAVFRGGFRHEEAEEAVGASLLDLTGLVEKSMLKATSTGLYRMHGMLRQFVFEQMTETSQDKTNYAQT